MIKQIALSCLILPACLLSSCHRQDKSVVESREAQDRRILLHNDASSRTDDDFKFSGKLLSGPTMYVCDDTLRLRVDFDAPRHMATVRTSDGLAYDLLGKQVASGIWYQAENAELRGRGTKVTWALNANKPTDCQIID